MEKGEGGHNFKLCGRGRCPRGADPEVTALTTVGNSCEGRKERGKALCSLGMGSVEGSRVTKWKGNQMDLEVGFWYQ